MQQFVVPQFIDVEDKIIGPITVRQFIILLLAGGLEFLAWKFADFSLFLAESAVIIVNTILFAFVKINGRPVHYFILNFIQTSKSPWLQVWGKIFDYSQYSQKTGEKDKKGFTAYAPRKTVGKTRLAELSLIVDTGGIYEGEEMTRK